MRLDIQRLSCAVIELKKSLLYLNNDDKSLVDVMISKYEAIISEYNKNNLTVMNPTKTEIGKIMGGLKVMVKAKYLNNIKSQKSINKVDAHFLFMEASNKTIIPQELVDGKILLRRRVNNSYEYTPLELALNQYLNIEILKEFNNQNKQLINTYNYESSK